MSNFLMKVTTNYQGTQFVSGETYDSSLIPDGVLDNWIEHGIAEASDFTPTKFVPVFAKLPITDETDDQDKIELDLTEEQIDQGLRPYKVYAALLTQSGTSAPVATILVNSLGYIPEWQRADVGSYYTILNSTTVDKIGLIPQKFNLITLNNQIVQINGAQSGADVEIDITSYLFLSSWEASDDVIVNLYVEFKIYP